MPSIKILSILLLLAFAHSVPCGTREKDVAHETATATVRSIEGDDIEDVDGELLLYVWPGVEPLNDVVLSA